MKAIINGKVITVTGKTYEKGVILYDKGKIVKVGENIKVPKGAEVIDASGMTVTPGLIDCHTHLCVMHGQETMPGHQDYNEMVDCSTPQVRALDALNPFDPAIEQVRAAGFTTVYTGPGSANVIGGKGCSFKLRGITADEMFIPGSEQMKMALGENPKRIFGLNGKTPMTRMGTAAVARNYLTRAKEYAAKLDKGEKVDFDEKLAALVPVVKGEMKVRIHCHRADDIATAVRLCKEFGLKYALEHATEGYKIAKVLADEGVYCTIGPLLLVPLKMEVWGLKQTTPGVLEKAGVNVCLTADGANDTQWLPTYAGIVVRYGMSHEGALRALTINPAHVMELEDRIGSIEPGKDADFAIFNGDPFSNYTECLMTIIDGEVLSDKRG
ncbi:MAG: amidohydrolase [Firmicutes bacterium]|nr:amidohydrolase [Bacillota bacterium]